MEDLTLTAAKQPAMETGLIRRATLERKKQKNARSGEESACLLCFALL